MDVNQVLEGTLSPIDAVRQNAELQLSQAAETDFASYLTTLAQALANEQQQSGVRQQAALQLKNALYAREPPRLRYLQNRWRQVNSNTKSAVKDVALKGLGTNEKIVGQNVGQFVAALAGAELPHNEWPELMSALVANVGEGTDNLKQSSLATIGYICDTEDAELRESLIQHSNAILTAVVQGARKEETNMEVRNAAIGALSDSMDFVRTNFENEGERNYIMQVVCEATQAEDTRVQAGSYGCLNRIMGLYYDKMRFYMEKALFGLTIMGMKNQDEDVAKLAVEFWCTVCEEEISIEDDNQVAVSEGVSELRPYFNFSRVAAREVIPVLLELLTQQDEDAGEDEYNISRAAYQCLQLFAQTIGADIMPNVLNFVEQNLRHDDWHRRDAAVSAFGAIMDGPDPAVLDPLVKQALPVLIAMMDDPVVLVKDSVAYALGRICENVSDSIDPQTNLPTLIQSLFAGLSSNPTMASSCCWALMSIAEKFAGDPGSEQNALSPHFQDSVSHLLRITESNQADSQLRMAAYEVLGTFVMNAANDSLHIVAKLSDVVLQRLEDTIPMQQQIVSVDDKNTLEAIHTSLSIVLASIIQRLEGEIKPQADRTMNVLLHILNTGGPKDSIFGTVGSLANALQEDDFSQYMDSFVPFLYNALGNLEDISLCAMAIGLVSDIARSLGEHCQPYCDTFMNYLLSDLQNSSFTDQLKPAILQCFGDIAGAIGPSFEKYLETVARVLEAAASAITLNETSFEQYDYVISLSEGIMDAWGGILIALKHSKAPSLNQVVPVIFSYLHMVAQSLHKSEALLRATMGVIGDLADAFPSGEYATQFQAPWLNHLIKDTRINREFQSKTTSTRGGLAKW